MIAASAISALLLLLAGVPLAYLYLILAGAVKRGPRVPPGAAASRFAIALPAHDEEGVIGRSVEALRRLDYPPALFDVYVVADHCSDATAQRAREAGASCFERTQGPRSGKGAAMAWLLERIWETGIPYDAVVVFDADTQVDGHFLAAMDGRLRAGERVIQGQHRTRNPQDGWYPAVSDAMFRFNNRVFNQGRANLGLSAMHMGDSICFRSDVLRRLGWGEGLTEDYDLRLRLLMEGLRIAYEPAAIGCGEAPATWADAARQRQRWLAGTYRSAHRSLPELLRRALARRDAVLLDGLAQAVLPSFSTLTVISGVALLAQLAVFFVWRPAGSAGLLAAWAALLGLLGIYPVLGLALDHAPPRALLAILSGPLFVAWRTWLAIRSRFLRPPATWIRTPRTGVEGPPRSRDLP